MSNLAVRRLNEENKSFKGESKASAMRSAVLEALCNFCQQDEEFTQAVLQNDKTFSDCMKAVAKGVGSYISDLEAYKKAVQFYFPGAEIKCHMTIDLIGKAAEGVQPITMTTNTEQVKKSVLDISLDDLFYGGERV